MKFYEGRRGTLAIADADAESARGLHAPFQYVRFDVESRAGRFRDDQPAVSHPPSVQDDARHVRRGRFQEAEVGNGRGEMGMGVPFDDAAPAVGGALRTPGLDPVRGGFPPGQPFEAEVVLHDVDPSFFHQIEEVGRRRPGFTVGHKRVVASPVDGFLKGLIERPVFGKGLFEPVDPRVPAAFENVQCDIERGAVVGVNKNFRGRSRGFADRVDHQHVPVRAFANRHPAGAAPDFDLEIAVAGIAAGPDFLAEDSPRLVVGGSQIVNVDGAVVEFHLTGATRAKKSIKGRPFTSGGQVPQGQVDRRAIGSRPAGKFKERRGAHSEQCFGALPVNGRPADAHGAARGADAHDRIGDGGTMDADAGVGSHDARALSVQYDFFDPGDRVGKGT